MSQLKLWQFDTPVTDDAVITAWQGRADVWLTRRQIAAAMRRAKTPAVSARCEGMVSSGKLFKEFIPLPNGVQMIVYIPNWEHETLQGLIADQPQTAVLF